MTLRVPDDAAELGEAVQTADADTLRRRFLGAPPKVTPALLTYLTMLERAATRRAAENERARR